MKKTLLLSSILLAGVGCAAEAPKLEELRTESLETRTDLIGDVFVSDQTFAYRTWDWDEKTGHSVARDVNVKLRLKFIPADHYSLDDKTEGLDYEVVVERFVEATGETFHTDNTYFARRLGDVKYQLFDCDSTARCHTDSNNARMYVFDTPQGKGMRLKNEGVWLGEHVGSELNFKKTL